MRTASKIAALAVLFVYLAGCTHKPQATPPVQAQAPVLPPTSMTQISPLPDVPQPPKPNIAFETQEAKTEPAPPKRKTPRRKPKPVTADPAQTPSTETAPPTQKGANSQPSETSPIGQLSTSSDNASTPNRRTIQDLIVSTENGLNNIKRPLGTEEQKTASQIRTFLAKAKDALNADDLDGAQTLTTKAHVLLAELTKP